jgi:hypothetical protein
VSSAARHIFWLDAPPVSAGQRAALARAFADASFYDENVRAVARVHAARAALPAITFTSRRTSTAHHDPHLQDRR